MKAVQRDSAKHFQEQSAFAGGQTELTAGRSMWSTSYTTEGSSVAQRADPLRLDVALNVFDIDVSKKKIRKYIATRTDVNKPFFSVDSKNIFCVKTVDLLESV